MMKKASIPQLEALRKIFEGKEPNAGLTGRSRAGGFANTMYSLWRNKWIEKGKIEGGTEYYRLTQAGLQVLNGEAS